jgi:putative glutathione S-transferase
MRLCRVFSLPVFVAWCILDGPRPCTRASAFHIPKVVVSRCIRNSQSATLSSTVLGVKIDKGFNLLELAGGVVPQGNLVKTAKEGWKFIWKRMMAELAPQDETGNYQRPSYKFQGRLGTTEFPDEAGRYHLYLGNPCPWCHRCLLAVNLLNLRDGISLTRLEDNPEKASRGGWIFSSTDRDPFGNKDLREVYDQLSPGYRGRCTAPLLVDKKSRSIVSNESSDIVRMLNSVRLGGDPGIQRFNLYPEELTQEIDKTNEWVYDMVNNGVYRCGFATTQAAYDEASSSVREGLAKVEKQLYNRNFLLGDQFSEADLRLLPTMLRFDCAYAPLFRAGGAHLRIRSDYPEIYAWLKRCWGLEGVSSSIDLPDACGSYYRQLFPLNPSGIMPTPVTAASLGLER